LANSLSIVRHRQLQNTTEPLGYIVVQLLLLLN
jgi:hypothetical protein